MVFKPEPHSIVDICFINIVSDASWLNKGIAREMEMDVDVLSSKPKYNYKELKELNHHLHSTNQVLIDDVDRQLNKFEKELKYLVKREHQLRDLNESVFEKLAFFAFLFSAVFALSQIVVFSTLRRFFAENFW